MLSAILEWLFSKQLDKLKDLGVDIGSGAGDVIKGAGDVVGGILGGDKKKDEEDGSEEEKDKGPLDDLNPF